MGRNNIHSILISEKFQNLFVLSSPMRGGGHRVGQQNYSVAPRHCSKHRCADTRGGGDTRNQNLLHSTLLKQMVKLRIAERIILSLEEHSLGVTPRIGPDHIEVSARRSFHTQLRKAVCTELPLRIVRRQIDDLHSRVPSALQEREQLFLNHSSNRGQVPARSMKCVTKLAEVILDIHYEQGAGLNPNLHSVCTTGSE